jgi:hypothetical protein
MSKTIEELEAYRNRKRDRQIDHARNMNLYMKHEDFKLAEVHRQKADEIGAMMDAINHCIKIVRDNES